MNIDDSETSASGYVTLTENWIRYQLLPKLVKWCSDATVTNATAGTDISTDTGNSAGAGVSTAAGTRNHVNTGSLRLVDVQTYYDRYKKMKDKYGAAITKVRMCIEYTL